MEQIVAGRLAPDRFNIMLYGGFAAVTLLLATIGIYGVMAFTVGASICTQGASLEPTPRRSY